MPISHNAVLNTIFESGLVDLRVTGAAFLANLANRNKMKTKYDTQLNWNLNVGGTGAHIESATSDGTQDSTANTVKATLGIGDYRFKHQFPISRVALQDAKIRAVATQGLYANSAQEDGQGVISDLADLFGAHLQEGVQVITEQINQTLFTGTGLPATANIAGLMKILDNTYAYAGVDPVTYPLWRSLQLRGAEPTAGNFTARPITKNLLMTLDRDVTLNGTRYDFIICHPNMALSYNVAFDTAAGSGAIGTLNNPDAFKNVDLGHNGRYYNTIPIIEDRHCPDGIMFFCNLRDYEVFSFRLADNPSPYGNAQNSFDVGNPTVLGLNFHLHEFETRNSAAREFELAVYPQFRVRNRKSLTALRDLQ